MTFLFWFSLLLAFLFGGIKAILDRGTDYFLRDIQQQLQNQQIHLQVEKLGFSLPSYFTLKQVQLENNYHWPLSIEQINIGSLLEIFNIKKLPQNLNINLQNSRLKIPEQHVTAPFIIKALGYDAYFISPAELKQFTATSHIQGDLHLQLKAKEQQLTLTAQFNSQDWGQWQLHIKLEQVADLPNWSKETLMQAQLAYLQMDYQDNGWVNRWLSFVAHRQGILLSELKSQFIQQLQNDLTRSAAPAFIFNALQDFIQQTDQLTIKLQPPIPLSLQQISQIDPNVMAQQLGFSIQ
ncbi:hypothetical protein TPSD3_15565 [Thioflexithrix psekupsensis]|uniref:Uncharacterized protein n=2 Tax=Thioflexithrix psekupsensis TaxID=1570016 RepID=A0A251X5X8_9GAMM|nr:hypothetical protein TPSD3_15565 [Thioflexithrix psekupsensis]